MQWVEEVDVADKARLLQVDHMHLYITLFQRKHESNNALPIP